MPNKKNYSTLTLEGAERAVRDLRTASLVDVGGALHDIYSGRLYECLGHKNFKEYAFSRDQHCGFGGRQCMHVLCAFKFLKFLRRRLPTCEHLPTCERQVGLLERIATGKITLWEYNGAPCDRPAV